jgi:hypothetical protein
VKRITWRYEDTVGSNLSESVKTVPTIVAKNSRVARMCLISTQSNAHSPSFQLLAKKRDVYVTGIQTQYEKKH